MKWKSFAACTLAVVLAFGLTACGRENAANQDQAAVETPAPTPTPATKEAQIVGSWSLVQVTDASGNTVDLSALSEVPGAGVLLGALLSEGATIEFTADGTIKFSVFSASYHFADEDTLAISTELASSDLNLPVDIQGDTLTLSVEDQYQIQFSRA